MAHTFKFGKIIWYHKIPKMEVLDFLSPYFHRYIDSLVFGVYKKILGTHLSDFHLSLIKFDNFLHKGAYIDEKDELGRTPLFYAVLNKNFDLINSFIRKGAYIYVVDNEGKGLKHLCLLSVDLILQVI